MRGDSGGRRKKRIAFRGGAALSYSNTRGDDERATGTHSCYNMSIDHICLDFDAYSLEFTENVQFFRSTLKYSVLSFLV
jgi:hypothetical protein